MLLRPSIKKWNARMMIHQRKWSQIKFWTFQRPPHVSYQNSQTKYRSNLFYNLIQSELLPLRLNYSECKTKIFWCVPGFLLEFVLLNLLLFCVPGSEETTTDCIYIVIFFFAKCDFASVTLFTRLLLPTWQSCHKSIQLCCCKVLKFCFICIFFQEPFKT